MEGECRERWARQTDFLPGIRSLDSGRLKYPFSVDKGGYFSIAEVSSISRWAVALGTVAWIRNSSIFTLLEGFLRAILWKRY